MNVTILLQKLINIEKAIGTETDSTVLNMVFDAEACLLQIQKEMIEGREPRHEAIRRLAGSILAA